MQALELLNQGKLDEAVTSAIEFVRNEPTNVGGREILSELFCIQGDLERADKQADTIVLQQPESAVTASLLRQLLRAETARRECWLRGRVPEFIGEPDEVCKQTLAAIVASRSGEHAEATDILAELAGHAEQLAGTCNGTPFTGFRDLDDFCVGIVEILTSTGKYFWVPSSRIRLAEFADVSRPRDLIWRQCELSVEDGPTGVVYIPAVYVNTHSSTDMAEKLGRATNWVEEGEQPVTGLGQRTFLVGEEEVGIMELKKLEINA
ncbi:MAG: type VI secretion system accessory protein TagJ [Pirellulaceae bacterium]